MNHLYTLKIALSYLAITLIFNLPLLATEPIEYCGVVQDSILVESDQARYTIEMDETVETLVLSNLEPGASYQLWVSSQTSGLGCAFDLSQNHQKQSAATEGHQSMVLIAKHKSEIIYIRPKNCANNTSFFADLSISKNESGDLNNKLSMMGIMTDPNYTALQLIEDVFIGGGCFEVSNVQPIGNLQGIGFFSNGTSSINIDEGVILASGAIGNSAGPNDVTNITTNFFDSSGDPDLNILSSGTVYDAVGIEFDFTPVVNTIQFNFVFASDEYCDYVNTGFNDAFGFFISGPGLSGPYTNGGENIALVPTTGQAVTINTINIQTNSAYYVDNVPIGQGQNAGGCVPAELNSPGAAEQDIEYDGFTTMLTATANVQVCESYHIRLVVGDVADGIFDSAVFLAANSFNTGGDVSMDIDLPGLGSSGLAYEGCAGDGYIIFERPPDGDLSQDYTVFFNIGAGSTATNGVDFTTLPPSVTIPAGQTQVLLPISIYEDFIAEGIETLILELDNPCTCQDASIEIQISDTPPMFVSTPELEFCNEQIVTLTADVSGGIPDFTYIWSTGESGPSINVNAMVGTQTYTVIVTDDCGNEVESTATVTVGEAAYGYIEGVVEVCDGNPIGILTITFTGNGPWDLTYMIDGIPQPPILGITENPYFLLVSELGVYTIGSLYVGVCPGIGDGSGIVLPTIFNSFSVVYPVSCPGLFDGAIDFIMAGGTPQYTYVWSNGLYTEDIDNLGAGVYTVTVTDANGCTHEDSVEIEEPEEMITNVVQVQGVDCLDSLSGSANLTVVGGNPGYTFAWDNGSILEDPIDLSAGPHTVTITDLQGCMTDAAVTITQESVPPIAEAEVSGILTCDEIQVFINGANSSGGDSLSYAWVDANGEVISMDTMVEVLDPGIYTLLVTNIENGCSDEISVNVDQNITPPIPQATGGLLNCNETEITLYGNGSSGAGTLGYSWLDSNGTEVGTLDTLNVIEPGMYTLVITDDSNGCTAETTAEVSQDINLPEPQADPSGILTCEELSVTIDGSGSTGNGAITYQWLDTNGDSLSIDTLIDVNEPGTYTLIITDGSNGCSAETTVQVDQNIDEPIPDAVANGVIDCIEISVFIDGSGSSSSGSITYQWLENGTVIDSTSGLDVSSPGTYTLVVTDVASGCTAETEVTVNEDITAPTPEATTSGILTCDSLTVTLDGSTSSGNGNILYEWVNGNGDVLSNDPNFEVGITGTYTLVITDDSNGCTAETAVTVNENIQDPVADAGDGGILNCNEISVNLDGSASSSGTNITYEWLNGANINVGNQVSIDVDEAGTYTLIVTDTINGCTASAQVAIDEDENVPDANAVVQGIIDCNDNTATLDGSASSGNGVITFQWLDSSGTEISVAETTSVTNPGIYTLVITDTDNGCSSETTIAVLENIQAPQPDILNPDLLTCSVISVELDATNSSGGGTITYQWQDSNGGDLGSNNTINVIDPGTYTLMITDDENGCTAETSVVVDQNIESPIPNASANGILTCEILNVTLDGSGSSGSGSLEYQWLDPNNAPIGTSISNDINTPGAYTLIVTNTSNGCTAETTVAVAQDINDPVAQAVVAGVLSCEIILANLDGTSSTGNNTISYQWLDPNGIPIANVPTLDVPDAGTYTLIVTDQVNGCTSESTVSVDANYDTPQPDAAADGLLTCENLAVLIDGSGSTSTGGLTYQWLDINNIEIGTAATLEVSSTGNYTLVITDQVSACTESITVAVDEDITLPLANAGPENTLTCDIETVILDGSNSSTGSIFEYEWINVGGVSVGDAITVEVGEAGQYTLVVTNTENGCTASSTVQVIPDENLPTADAGIGSLLTCDILEATLNGSGSSTGINISYEWLDANGNSMDNNVEITVSDPGIYTLVVTDQNNGCSATSSVEVDQNTNAPQANPGNSPTLTCEETVVMLDGSGSVSAMGDLTYEWFDNNGTSIGTDSTIQVDLAGIYTLVVTSANGCINSAAVEVLVDANVPVSDPGENGMLNCDVSLITLGGTNTSTGTGITYQWMNANNEIVGTSQFLEVTTPDTYTLFVFNSTNNCEIAADVIVGQNIALPEVDAGAGGLLTCLETEIFLGGAGTSTGPNYQYEWTDMNGQVLSIDSLLLVTEPGTYTITVFNTENGCEAFEEITITQNIETPVASAGPDGILTCDITEVTLDGSGSTGQNLSYQWLNEGGIPIDIATQIQVSQTGIYTLMVTNDANGCTSSANVEVIPDENLPTAIATETGILTCDVSQVLIDAGSSTSISGNIAFEWLDTNNDFLSNDPDLMVAVPGIYTVIVTDTENGCTISAVVEVPQDIDIPQVFAGENDILTCTITDLQLNGSATNGSNFGFEWFDINNIPIAQTPTVSVSTAGLYTLVVTNLTNGCSASDQVELIPDTDLPLAVAGPGNTLTCAVESVILDASSSEQGSTIIYEWQDPNGNTISDELQVEVNQPGIYTIIVTDSGNNCAAQDVVNVAQDINDPLAAIDGIGPIELNCDINEVVLNGGNSSPFNDLAFDWSTANGNIITATDIYEIEVDEPGTYVLTVINLINGCTDTQTYNIGENVMPPSAFINTPPVINCYFPAVNVNAVNTSGNGNFDFSWTAADGSGIVSGENTLTLTVNESGTYILSIENLENGCDQTAAINVLADLDVPDAVANVADDLDCVTESVQLIGTGSSTGAIFNYEWQGSGILNGAFTLQPTVNQSGAYTLLVTNTQNGCKETAIVNVFENENVPDGLDLGVIPPPCPGDAASIQIVSVTGGEEPYLYSIDGGNNFYDLTLFLGLDPGDYDVVVQDIIGCEYGEFVNIPEADNIFMEIDLILEIELGDTVQLNATANVPEWALSSIVWTPSSSLSCDDCMDPFAFPHETTTYFLTVLNENGCPASDDITLRVRKNRGIFIPNVFTPFSSSGYNDIFHIFSDGKSVKNINKFQVFDRWGESVFEDYNFLPDDPAHGWDGYLRGEPMNPAVFVYFAEVEFIDGEVIIFKGGVTLVEQGRAQVN